MKTSLPYEIHVTVEEGYVNPFKVACLALGVKPLLIQAQRDGEYDMESFEDLQTSSVIRGTLSDVWAELDRIREGLTEAGFTVIREKVETCPEYPDAPALSKESQEMPIGCYFEAHIPVEMPNDSWLESRLEHLGEIAKQHSAHLSRNAFKAEEEVAIFMVTLRDHHSPLEGFEWAKCKLEDCLYSEGFNTASPFSPIIEFVVHDTNLAHDDKWIGKGTGLESTDLSKRITDLKVTDPDDPKQQLKDLEETIRKLKLEAYVANRQLPLHPPE